MISLFHARFSTILSRAAILDPPWKASSKLSCVRAVNLRFLLKKHRIQCYSSSSYRRRTDSKQLMMENQEFFVVRKGDLVGVYKSLTDCQALVGTSICDPPISVYRGCSMNNETEDYLVSRGLKNSIYSISVSDLTKELFGILVECPLKSSSSSGESRSQPAIMERLEEEIGSNYGQSCTLEFDGSSKGNPGQAGAGAILRYDDGSLICRLSEGLGVATCNYAEYRGFILGLKYAIGKGFTNIRVKGDSKLVCMQIQGLWKVRSQNLLSLYKEADELKGRFRSFEIMHVLRDLNSEADIQANLGAQLAEGEIQTDLDG